MKTFSTRINAEKPTIKVFNSINYISVDDLKKYLDIAKPFLSEATQNIIDYLIVNNDTYVNDLSTPNDENALAGFYNAGKPKNKSLTELWNTIDTVVKSGRILEIPVLQSPEQFKSILNKEVAADEIILDLTTEDGRNHCVKQYTPLIHKICHQWMGKSNLSYDELYSAALEGFTYAMNRYGKRNKSKVDDDKILKYTFGQYAAHFILVQILEAIKNESQTVRIPVSAQNKERKEKGSNRKNNSISGDSTVGKDKDGNKTLFDFMGSVDDSADNLDTQDMQKIKQEIFKELEAHFDPKIMDIWYSSMGENGHKQMKNKDIAKKYNVNPSNITYYTAQVKNFCLKDKKMLKLFKEFADLVHECRNNLDKQLNVFENPVHIIVNENTSIKI